jgi:hypothetical protein
MKKITVIAITFLLSLFNISLFAQTDSTAKADTTVQALPEVAIDELVRNTFSSSTILDNQTVMTPAKGGKEFIIQHRFGDMKTIKDLFGLYGASNIRLALNYGITDKIMIGFGTERDHKMQEFLLKVALLKQTKSNKIPVSVTYFGNAVLDGRDKSVWGINYYYERRWSYVNSIIVARKFNKRFSLQASAAYAHFNQVDTIKTNDIIALTINGKCKIAGPMSAIFEYDYTVAPVKTLKYYQEQSKPNASIGFDINTGTHNFQLFVASYRSIIAQQNYMYNKNDFTKGKVFIGFNIIVRL